MRHLILSMPRSGSTYLKYIFNQHPNLKNYGEVLNRASSLFRWRGNRSMAEYLDWIYGSKPIFYGGEVRRLLAGRATKLRSFDSTSVGIKAFCYDHVLWKKANIFDWLHANTDVKIVYLVRENLVQQLVSMVFAEQRKVWNSKKDVRVADKIEIDIEKFWADLESAALETDQREARVAELCNPCLRVTYEDYFRDSHAANREIFEFLGVDVMAAKGEAKKVLPDALPDKLVNYDALEEKLKDTQFAKFL